MGMKVASSSPSLQWMTHHSSSPSRTLSCHFVWQRQNRSAQLHRSKSCELWESSSSRPRILPRVCSSASFDPLSDDEFSKKIQELTLRFKDDSETPRHHSVLDLPLSLRVIKKKRECEQGVKEVGETSMNKAFSSMVFMIRELQSFTLHMREILFYQDLQGILLRVREEMHQSFVWLFQRVFSTTPTLMVYVMLLLANFTVYSIGSNNSALAAPTTTITELTSERTNEEHVKFDSSVVKTFFVSTSPNGNTTSVGGNGGGGGNIKPVLSGTDGDGFDDSEQLKTIIPQGGGVSQLSILGQDEHKLWDSMVEKAERMQYSNIDRDTRERLVSDVEARVEGEEDTDYLRTELMYQTGLSQEPNNPLLLTNYAQFLYLVSNDHDRAEEYFKRAVGVEPKDAEALSKYATFLWRVRDDLWAVEETFLEAIETDPTNSFYAANYANFLWNTGGDDTCFPLDDEPHENTI